MISNKKNKISNPKSLISNISGFTLLETVITLFIVTLMLAFFLTNYREGSRNTDLTFSVQKLVSDFRTAQNNSLGSVYYDGVVPTGGWGVHFDKTAGNNTKYFIFADNNAFIGNKLYDVGEADPAKGAQVITLPANIVIDDLKDSAGVSHDQIDITFLPPDPLTRIYWVGVSAATSSATVVLKETTRGKTKSTVVNVLGLIETP